MLRDAMAADGLEKAGLYFGTRSGKVFASRDDGTSWRAVAEGLPPVVCVKAARVAARSRPAQSARRSAGRRARAARA